MICRYRGFYGDRATPPTTIGWPEEDDLNILRELVVYPAHIPQEVVSSISMELASARKTK
jgi:hypothetical protein